ncbi:MAG TPA: hypothetical protein PL059_07065 [Spirochaetota bacterium]|nr:hypothetical protein [Spirochaetota bacterium]HOM10752.1 hypothetical protein [Spirochaetota bacterium]
MRKVHYICIIIMLWLPCRVNAGYYPFILTTTPVTCHQCKHFDNSLYQSLVYTLTASGIFIGDSSSYSIPAGAYNPPGNNQLLRNLSIDITYSRKIHYKELTTYLKEKVETESYTIAITIASSENPQEFTALYPNISPHQLEHTFNSIAQDILQFYSSKRIPVLYQSPFAFYVTGLTLAPVYSILHDKLNNYAHSATGFQCLFTINNTYIPLTIMPSITWFTLNNPIKTINSWHSVSFMMHAGYQQALPFSVSITPYIGAGYILHYIEGDKTHTYPPYSYSHSFYYNPQVATGIIFELILDPQLSLEAGAAYNMFFASSSQFSYLQYSFGFTFHGNILLYQATPYH